MDASLIPVSCWFKENLNTESPDLNAKAQPVVRFSNFNYQKITPQNVQVTFTDPNQIVNPESTFSDLRKAVSISKLNGSDGASNSFSSPGCTFVDRDVWKEEHDDADHASENSNLTTAEKNVWEEDYDDVLVNFNPIAERNSRRKYYDNGSVIPSLNVVERDVWKEQNEDLIWCDEQNLTKVMQRCTTDYDNSTDNESIVISKNLNESSSKNDKYVTSTGSATVKEMKNKFSMDKIEEGRRIERDFPDFEDFKRELELTLTSKHGGYSNVNELASHFTDDTGVAPEKIANRYGFSTFEALLRSNMLRSVVRIEMDVNNCIRYMPHFNPIYDHIHEAQSVSNVYVQEKNDKVERRRLAMIYQPGVQELLLEGRIRLVEMAGEVGAERRYVDYREIRDSYLEHYKTELNRDELKRLFNHPSLLHVFSVVCTEDFEVNEQESYDGQIYVKLRQPLEKLRSIHAECKVKLANGESIVKRQKMPKKPKVPLSEQNITLIPIIPKIE